MNNIIDKFSFQGVLHDIEPASSHREATEVSLGYEVLYGNKTFISQITKTNTIYEIRDYFDLGGGEEGITLPANCVLKFSGGMLANGTVIGNGVTIEAPLVRIFADNITLKGDFNCDFYSEWFGAVTYSEDTAVDNAAVFNNAITQIYNMNGAHDLILTGAYLIRDTIFLKPKSSLIGRYAKTSYDTAIGNKEVGSGFLVDFDDNNKYAIDSCVTQLRQNDAYAGKKLAIIKHNHLWFDPQAAAEDSYTLSDKIVDNNGNETTDNSITGKLWFNGWRKSINIKNIILQPLNKPTQSSEIPFGGIRLISWFSGTIDSVTIQGFAVCLNIASSWSCYINRLNILTHYIGVYFGKHCTQCDIRNSDIERITIKRTDGTKVYFDHKTAALIYRNKANLLLPYDDAGRVDGDEGFTYPITKYIATPESVDDDFLTNYANTQLLTVAIMTESYTYDQTKLLLDNIVFQAIDGIFINTNICNASFNFCYIEAVTKLGLYSHSGVVRWLNPSFAGNKINPYAAVTFEGKITIEDMSSPRCYPSYTIEDVKSGLTRPRYYITPQVLYYDKFIVTPENSGTTITQGVPMYGTVEVGSVAAAKQLVPINNTYYVGGNNWVDKYSWEGYDELGTGLEPTNWTSFENIINHYNPKVATIYTIFTNSDFSLGGTLFKNIDYTFIKQKTNFVNYHFSLSQPMRLQDSKIKVVNHAIVAINGFDHIFEVSRKCTLWFNKIDLVGGTKLIKLVSDNNKPVELDIIYNKEGYNAYYVYSAFLSHLDEYGVKYTLKITTLTDTMVCTNKTPPTKGVIPGETFVYNGETLTWSGTEWVAPAPEVIPNSEIYEALGAEYNDTDSDITKSAPWGEEVVHKKGRWYYNGIGDLSTNDMLQIYSHKDILATNATFRNGTVRQDLIRTNMPMEFAQSVSQISIDSVRFFFRCAKLQVLRWGWKGYSFYDKTEVTFNTTNTTVMPKMGTSMIGAFGECYKLEYIYPINVSDTTDFTNAFLMGVNCGIKDVRLYGLKANISFKDCPYLKKECLMYIISNANPTTAITITLHATAYANLAEDTEIVAKLDEKNAAVSANGGSIGLLSV